MSTNYPEIFILVGSGRCGTRYLSHRLRESMDIGFRSQEPNFVVPLYQHRARLGDLGESRNLKRFLESVQRYQPAYTDLSIQPEEILKEIQKPTYTAILYAFFYLVAKRQDKSRLGYKDPRDVFNLPLLSEIFPTARFIHLIRDGRDVALSFLKFRWGPTNLYTGTSFWAKAVSTARRDGANLGERYFELRFEDLILDTEKAVWELSNFVGQDGWMEHADDLLKRVKATRRPESANKWRQELNADQRRLCEAAAGDMLRACGYPTEFGHKTNISPVRETYYRYSDFVQRRMNRALRFLGKYKVQ